MKRKLKSVKRQITPLPVDGSFDPVEWLQTQALEYQLKYLLAHADDGVIWGRMNGNGLELSNQDFSQVSPPLRWVTLQQARLFGPQAELFLWPAGQGWQARLIEDGTGAVVEYYDEAQILWGNKRRDESTQDFTLVADGDMGHWHAVPLPTTGAQFTRQEKPYHPLRLQVRHYLSQDEASGLQHVTLSRLTDLTVEEAK